MMPKSTFKDLPSVLQAVLKEFNLSDTVAKEQLINNWNKIVGDKLSDKCIPVELNDGVLIIKAKNYFWKEELALRQQDLVNLLDGRIGLSLVKKIKII
jgi:predicted nucleic acid-binding Zn ribbon protein